MNRVAPLAGAWIEISKAYPDIKAEITSLPSRERGLKSSSAIASATLYDVAPLAGAWIEIPSTALIWQSTSAVAPDRKSVV